MDRQLRAVAALGAALIAVSALGVVGPAQAASPASPAGLASPVNSGWPHGLSDPFARRVEVAGNSGQLNGVFCTAATDCWAVGQTLTKLGRLNQVLHWTGKKWFVVSAPTPAGTLPGDENVLLDVACTSASSCWAVGDYGTDDSTTRGEIIKNQALFWNGKSWSLVSTPNPAGAKKNHANALGSIRCASPAECWAAGAYGVLGKKFIVRNQMLHWTGKKWTQVLVPNLAGTTKGAFNELFGLSCTSAKSCLAVGAAENLVLMGKAVDEVLSWNGTKWRSVHVPNPDGTDPGSINGLTGVTCGAARDCWAVGTYGSMGSEPMRNQALHWTGTKWKAVSTPNPGGNGKEDRSALSGVRCTSPANCWAVGVHQHNNGPDRDQILHWNGTKWSDS